jgi:hypothetical protein
MAKLKGYITEKTYRNYRNRYKECIRMLNGLEKTSERKVMERDRRWQISEELAEYCLNKEFLPHGWLVPVDIESWNLE